MAFVLQSVTPDIENFGKRRGLQFTRVTPAPPEVPKNPTPEFLTTPLRDRYANRYLQIFKGTVNAPPGSKGLHDEPLAEKDMLLMYMPSLPNDNYERCRSKGAKEGKDGEAEDGFTPSEFSFAKLSYTEQEVQSYFLFFLFFHCLDWLWSNNVNLLTCTLYLDVLGQGYDRMHRA
jgi:hypothetical protein